jgi:PAS domain S-box-containing protein
MATFSSDADNILTHQLQERIKQLDCIYAISFLAADQNATFDEILRNIADRVPLAFQAPDHTSACITVFDKIFKTANFKTCPCKLEVDLVVDEENAGKLEVGYLGALPDEGSPFLEEEKNLLQAIAACIGTLIRGKRQIDSLEESEKRYRNVVEHALVGISQTNLKGELLYANNTFLSMFGYGSLEEARSAPALSPYRNPEDRQMMMEALKQTGKLTDLEVECVTKTGQAVFVLFSATLESDVITTIMRDITKRKLAEQALIKSERSLSEAQQLAHLGNWEWDIARGVHRWSEESYRIFGLSPQEVEPSYETFLASVHPDDRREVDQANQEAVSDPGKPYSTEYRVVRPDGTERFVQARADVLFDQNHRAVRMIGTLQDITERKRAEEALKNAFEEISRLKDQLEAENISLREEVELKGDFREIIGVSDSIKYVKQRVQQVASTNATVLLTGETGTGKGVFARAIHELSERKNKPFVHVNCAGLPPNLIESELFGREKGAFTGSTARQIGRFELAKGGTLFLDDIGELRLDLQSKLLKVLEEGEFERLGSPHAVKADVRVIASTNRQLEEDIKQGLFRMDLFYRLNVFPVTVPPLRQRRADIPLLVDFFVKSFSQRYRKGIRMIPKKTMKAMVAYDWPGNVREMINVIERAVIVSNGPVLRLAEKIDVPPNAPVRGKRTEAVESRGPRDIVEVERKHILNTLLRCGWKISGPKGAAQVLGLNANTLRSRMNKLGIKRPTTP